jgi:hypothetical protein
MGVDGANTVQSGSSKRQNHPPPGVEDNVLLIRQIMPALDC